MKWPHTIDTAPKDGTEIDAIWICNGQPEFERRIYWHHGQWVDKSGESGWTPTHWRQDG